MNYVYILRCKDNTLYTGWTTDIEKRLKTHNSGNGAKYTRGRTPVVLEYYEIYESKKEATKREYVIKKFDKNKKEKLIKNFKINDNNL